MKKQIQPKKSYILHSNLYNVLLIEPAIIVSLIKLQNFKFKNFKSQIFVISKSDNPINSDFRIIRIHVTYL